MRFAAAGMFAIAIAILVLSSVLWLRMAPFHSCTIGGTPGVTQETFVTQEPCP